MAPRSAKAKVSYTNRICSEILRFALNTQTCFKGASLEKTT